MALAVRGGPRSQATPQGSAQPPQLHQVVTASGEELTVIGDAERRWFEATRDRYLADYALTETTDLRDLDRLLVLELLSYRMGAHLAAGADYYGAMIDEDKLRKQLREFSTEVNKVKDQLGMSKAARDKAANEGSVAQYLTELRARAKAFGIKRNHEVTKAIALLKELFALITAFDNSDEEERAKLGLESPDDILQWVRDVAKPEFDAIDAHFRQTQQRLWIREN